MSSYERGRWDMFEEITSSMYGKQCYFMQDNGVVYSRLSDKYLTIEEAYNELLAWIEDGWEI